MIGAASQAEALLRSTIAAAETSARNESALAELCRDPKNIRQRRINAEIYGDLAADLRHALAEHLLLDGVAQ